jgi:two-component system osmolarity sensor histidine kinase EnvZ
MTDASFSNFFLRLKQYLPQSIFTRFLLITVIPMLLAQIFAIYMFYERHWSNVSERLEIALANEIALVIHSSGPYPEEASIHGTPLAMARRYLQFNIRYTKNTTLPTKPVTYLKDFTQLSTSLKQQVTYPYHLYFTDQRHFLNVDVQLAEGTLHIATSRKRLETPTTYIFIMWMTGTTILLLLISIIFMRNQIRPIIRLARAADKFGKGKDIKKLKPEGATEIRKATQAFLDMKTRIDRLVSQRTEMLAGVSHDLRTPLTRMRLQLAMIPPFEGVKELEQDIIDMEKMIHGYLDFAKSGLDNPDQTIHVLSTFEKLAKSYRTQQQYITLSIPNNAQIRGNPDYFDRIARNLIDNGLRYAKHVAVTVETTKHHFYLCVDDDGPGIPIEKREEVFKPFYRLDTSRNLDTAGVGLGLAVVRDLVARCGGEITLHDSPEGGLQVKVTLPL